MRREYRRWIGLIGGLIGLLLVVAAWSLTTGEIRLPLSRLPHIWQDKNSLEYTVLAQLRWPRLLLGFSVGGALGLSGAVLQTIFRNPLVEPYTLGISGGASLGVALLIVFGSSVTGALFSLPLAGFTGALLTMLLVYGLGIRKGSGTINRMLLIGVMISFISSSLLTLLLSLSSQEAMHHVVFWTMGSLNESNPKIIRLVLAFSLFGMLFTSLLARPLNALQLGEAKARYLGINTSLVIKILFVVTSLLTGMSVAVSGVIGFVGLVTPHVIRLLVGSDCRILLWGSYLGGAVFLMACDVLSRTLIAPLELPVGVFTGIIGGLLFIAMLVRSHQKSL